MEEKEEKLISLKSIRLLKEKSVLPASVSLNLFVSSRY